MRRKKSLRVKQAGQAAVVDDGDDEHPVMEEDLGDLGVREVGSDVDVLGVHVPPDQFDAAADTPVQGLVE